MNRPEYSVVGMRSLSPEINGNDNVVDFKQYNFINLSRSRLIVPADARVSHISVTIDGKEVCSTPLNLHPENLCGYELETLHNFFGSVPLMQSVPMVIKFTSSIPIMVEAQCVYFTTRTALKIKPYAERMWNENEGRLMPTHEELSKLLQ